MMKGLIKALLARLGLVVMRESTYHRLVAAADVGAATQPMAAGRVASSAMAPAPTPPATSAASDESIGGAVHARTLHLDAAAHCAAGMPLLDGGDIEGAFLHFSRALAVVHKYGPGVNAMRALSDRYYAGAREAFARNDGAEGRRLLVRAVEAAPNNTAARSELDRLIATAAGTDLTRHCYVFHDPARAEAVHREAVLRCLEYVSIAGVAGDVLEFGVLAGWSARIFAETMRDLMNMGTLRLFDSFDGLPDYASVVDRDSYEIKGRNLWADRMRFSDDFVRDLGSTIDVHVRNRLADVLRRERIVTYRGFYSESLERDLAVKAAIVHIDCDLYQSTVEVLRRLHEMDVFQDGCVLMFDDWNCNKASPNYGERRAFREYLSGQDRFTHSPFFTYGFNGAAFFLHERVS